mgnify:CR=1 FL=1
MSTTWFIVLGVFTLSFAISWVRAIYQLKNVAEEYAKLFVDNAVMQEYIDIIKSSNDLPVDEESVHRENFIKFLSDSRDWAFNYIEEVQGGLKEFVDTIDKDIQYFDQYGDSVAMKPNYETLIKISIAYKKLKELLPEGSETK